MGKKESTKLEFFIQNFDINLQKLRLPDSVVSYSTSNRKTIVIIT